MWVNHLSRIKVLWMPTMVVSTEQIAFVLYGNFRARNSWSWELIHLKRTLIALEKICWALIHCRFGVHVLACQPLFYYFSHKPQPSQRWKGKKRLVDRAIRRKQRKSERVWNEKELFDKWLRSKVSSAMLCYASLKCFTFNGQLVYNLGKSSVLYMNWRHNARAQVNTTNKKDIKRTPRCSEN